MNIDDFFEGIHILQINYGQIFSKEKLDLYYENLKEMKKNDYLDNINNLIKTSKFMPNIAEILNYKTQISCNYIQRNYDDCDLNNFYANRRYKNGK